MVTLQTIHYGYLPSLIHEAFKGDRSLINEYHRINGSLNTCVKDTFYQIDKASREGTALDFYGVFRDGEPIGFTVLGKKMLFSFGIQITHRQKEVVTTWWQLVRDKLGPEFVTWLFKKNSRAIAFLLRNDMEIHEETEDIVTLIYLKPQTETICQQEG